MILPASDASIKKAAQLLQAGELVAFPTETVYGLGANALDSIAVSKIFELKNRPSSNPLIVHVATIEAALALISPTSNEKIFDRFKKLASLWPGPLSIIVPKIKEISNLVSAGGETIAIRIPNHPVAEQLLKACNLPLAAPSANKSFAVSPTSADHVEESFSKNGLTILDGGACQVGLESTVVDITSEFPIILRPGLISATEIEKTLEEPCLLKKVMDSNQPLRSPGLFDLHYSPQTPLVFIEDLEKLKSTSNIGLILLSSKSSYPTIKAEKILFLTKDGNVLEAARNLYKAIREMDAAGLQLIAIEIKFGEDEVATAIMDRLNRARHLPI